MVQWVAQSQELLTKANTSAVLIQNPKVSYRKSLAEQIGINQSTIKSI